MIVGMWLGWCLGVIHIVNSRRQCSQEYLLLSHGLIVSCLAINGCAIQIK